MELSEINWLAPLTWMGAADYATVLHEGAARRDCKDEDHWRSARVTILEMLGDYERRPTDAMFILGGFVAAHYAANIERGLTRRQEAALAARNQALQEGKFGKTALYTRVGNLLGITRPAAFKLIQRADARLGLEIFTLSSKMEQIAPQPSYIVEAEEILTREQAIKRKMATLGLDCPGAGHPVCEQAVIMPPAFCCRGCYQEWGRLPEPDRPVWFTANVRAARRDARQRAIEALFFDRLEPELM